MSTNVVIIDYNAGNLKSVVNMLNFLGATCEVTSDVSRICSAQRILFPGQGHFKQAMANLAQQGLVEPIKNVIASGVPFLGICLGLQILFEKSEEAPNVAGLGILKGEAKRFTQGKVPQIGWNKIETTVNNSFLSDDYFYFVNSYYVVPENENVIAAKTLYGVEFCSAIEKENLCAVQFHPEKSSEAGCEFFLKWFNKT